MNSKVNWGAILAGAFLAFAGNGFFWRMALATGIPTYGLAQPMAPTINLLGALYTVLTAAAAFALGGYCTVRLAGLREGGGACLHALTSFAVSGVISRILFTPVFFRGNTGLGAQALVPGSISSAGQAWTLCATFIFGALAASAGGVWATKAKRKIVTRTYASELEQAEGEERWPAA